MITAEFSSFSAKSRFRDLSESVQQCSLCPRLCERRKVLTSANGSIESKVLFIAEAPGRLGADRTGIPLHGDRTGDNFESLLGNIGWDRNDVFITNAVLCNPRNDDGNNGTPTNDEILNCSMYLRMVIELIQPAVIATLGATALKAMDIITSHGKSLSEAVAEPMPWNGRLLFPLYHPAPRALIHRSLIKQRSDFIKLSKLVNPSRGLKTSRSVLKRLSTTSIPSSTSPLNQTILALVQAAGPMSWFKLTKMLYLVDLQSINTNGHSVTQETYIRQAAGPWAPTLNKSIKTLNGFEVRIISGAKTGLLTRGPSPRFAVELPDQSISVILDIAARYANKSDAEIATAAYLTAPMKYVLREEKKGRNMLNTSILHSDKTVIDLDKRIKVQ